MPNLADLEYPRHLHRTGGAFLHVNTAAEAQHALNDGWFLDVPPEPPVEAPVVPQGLRDPVPEPVRVAYGRRKVRA